MSKVNVGTEIETWGSIFSRRLEIEDQRGKRFRDIKIPMFCQEISVRKTKSGC